MVDYSIRLSYLRLKIWLICEICHKIVVWIEEHNSCRRLSRRANRLEVLSPHHGDGADDLMVLICVVYVERVYGDPGCGYRR